MTAPDPRQGEIEARLSKATPGPWFVEGMDAGHSQYEMNLWIETEAGDVICDMDGLQRSRNEHAAKDDGQEDAEFIANAPADVAYLLAELRKAQDALAAVDKLLTEKHKLWAAICGNTCSKDINGVDHDAIADEVAEAIRAAVAAATGGEE